MVSFRAEFVEDGGPRCDCDVCVAAYREARAQAEQIARLLVRMMKIYRSSPDESVRGGLLVSLIVSALLGERPGSEMFHLHRLNAAVFEGLCRALGSREFTEGSPTTNDVGHG